MLTKEKIEKSLSPCRNLTLTTFWRISNSDFSKGKSIPPPLFYIPEVLPSRSDQEKQFAEIFSDNSNLDESVRWEVSKDTNYHSVSRLSVGKIFVKIVNNKLID